MKIRLTLLILLCCIYSMTSQNLLNTSTWTVGTGNVAGFGMYGIAEKNQRELGLNHAGDEVVLWKSLPDDTNFQDGGFYSSYVAIDHTKTYRFSIWIKKTNSDTGHTFFGCHSYTNGQHQTLKLDGTTNTNPYFWYGDLPALNKWYLLVGYIHGSNYSSNINLGRIYDGETTEEVLTITDFKFSTTAINTRSRVFLAYDTNSDDRQYLYNPTIEEINGTEATLNQLFDVNEDSKLIFHYDNAGSQKQRFYCVDALCVIPTPPIGKPTNDEVVIVYEEELEKNSDEEGIIENQLSIFPNPTNGKFSINLVVPDYELSDFVNIYNVNGALVKQVKLPKNVTNLELDIATQPSGIYFIHIHFSNGDSITRKIIKK